MSRLEFMKQLARLLDDLPREEKIEILKYYNGYFDDAGAENEAAIIEALGSPERVASEVKAGIQEELTGTQSAADDDSNIQENQADRYGAESVDWEECPEANGTRSKVDRSQEDEDHESASYCYGEDRGGQNTGYEKPKSSLRQGGSNGWKMVAIVAILMVTFPIWIGLLGGLIGLLGGAIGVIVTVIVGLFGALIGLAGAVIGCIVGGIGSLLTAPITGMLSLAVGIFLLGVLLLIGLLVGLIFGKFVPGIIGGIGKLIRGIGQAVGGVIDGVTGRR